VLEHVKNFFGSFHPSLGEVVDEHPSLDVTSNGQDSFLVQLDLIQPCLRGNKRERERERERHKRGR
jgi:hypothetical protein